MIRNLSITNRGLAGTEVLIDGHDIANSLTGLTLSMGANQPTVATLDLLIPDVTELHDTETRIHVPLSTRAALIALGWTPPAEPEPTEDLHITPYLVVHRYRTDRGTWAWSWNCDGDDTCEGHRALDLDNRAVAEANAHDHLDVHHVTWRDAEAAQPSGSTTTEPTP